MENHPQIGIAVIQPTDWTLANGCVPTFFMHSSSLMSTSERKVAVGDRANQGRKRRANKKKGSSSSKDNCNSPSEISEDVEQSEGTMTLKVVEDKMLRSLQDIEYLQSSEHTSVQAARLEEIISKEFEKGLDIPELGEIEHDGSLPAEFVAILEDSLANIIANADRIKELLLGKARDIKKMEESDNSTTTRCFKLLKEKVSLFSATTKSSLENKRLEDVCEKLRDLCRYSQQRIKLAQQNHDTTAASSEKQVDELVSRFRATIDDIHGKIANYNVLKEKQEAENEDLSKKIAEFREHAKLRSDHYSTQLRAKSLELQLAEVIDLYNLHVTLSVYLNRFIVH